MAAIETDSENRVLGALLERALAANEFGDAAQVAALLAAGLAETRKHRTQPPSDEIAGGGGTTIKEVLPSFDTPLSPLPPPRHRKAGANAARDDSIWREFEERRKLGEKAEVIRTELAEKYSAPKRKIGKDRVKQIVQQRRKKERAILRNLPPF